MHYKKILTVIALFTIAATLSLSPAAGFPGAGPVPQQSKTGPDPSPEVILGDELKAADHEEYAASAVTLPVPAYEWRHGCGPTAVGMVLGYYDANGFGDLVSGSAATQTDAVDQMIASGGEDDAPNSPGMERHFEDYAQPVDYYPNLQPDNYLASGRAAHSADSLADLMNTSKSAYSNYYGWSWSTDVDSAFKKYVKMRNAGYDPTSELYYSTFMSWALLTSEIDAGRPMVFLVDSSGDGETDHFVSVIGYRTSPTLQYASWDTWSTTTIRWQDFRYIAAGAPWGIWGGWTFRIDNLTAKNTLKINANSLPATLDPQRATFAGEIGHLKLIYEGLTRLNANSQTVPAAAQSWTFASGGKQLFFHLRDDLRYSDGSRLNAKRFEYAILRAIDPLTGSEYASIFDNITGAAAYRSADPATLSHAQLAALRAQVQVRAYDTGGNLCSSYEQWNCRTLWVGFTTPTPAFPTLVSTWLTFPVKEELLNSDGAAWWQAVGNLTGNGPFILTGLNVDSYTNFVPNPYYWRGVPAYNIRYAYINDPALAYTEYKNGNLDITATTPTLVETGLLSQYYAYPGVCTYAVQFHNTTPPFTDPKIRAAFAYAFDRAAWVRDVLGGSGIPTLTWIPPGVPGYQSGETRWGYDPAKAQQALAESTYGSADNLPPITVYYSDSPRNNVRWQWLADQWKTVLGVNITLAPVTAGNPLPTSMIYILGWCGDYPDQGNYLSTYWRTGGFAQRIGFSNAQIDTLLNQADVEMNPTTRAALYTQTQDLLVQNVPVAFGWNNLNAYLVRPAVRGVQKSTFDTLWPGDVDPLGILWAEQVIYVPLVTR
jgi:oligopeptide transport system substrate-binding protein